MLWEEQRLDTGASARFHSPAGALTARRDDGWIALDFPALPPAPVEPPPELVRALGVAPLFVGRNRHDYLVAVATEAEVRAVQPDLALLRAVETRGITVTARASTPGYDVVSRFFAPRAGLDEDWVTGSAHCALGPFWAERLGRDRLVGFQASRRGGVVRVRVDGERVELAGRAVTVLRGELLA